MFSSPSLPRTLLGPSRRTAGATPPRRLLPAGNCPISRRRLPPHRRPAPCWAACSARP
uniref:Uncharacterized protein n=1 Tax=Arundo donax TaxID=35708 RepID=A0A0A9BY39_ARUDO